MSFPVALIPEFLSIAAAVLSIIGLGKVANIKKKVKYSVHKYASNSELAALIVEFRAARFSEDYDEKKIYEILTLGSKVVKEEKARLQEIDRAMSSFEENESLFREKDKITIFAALNDQKTELVARDSMLDDLIVEIELLEKRMDLSDEEGSTS